MMEALPAEICARSSRRTSGWRSGCLAELSCEQSTRTARGRPAFARSCSVRSEEHTSELQSLRHLVCRLLLEKKKTNGDQDYDLRLTKKNNRKATRDIAQ